MGDDLKLFVVGIVGVFLSILIGVLVGGHTFGQRCAKVYEGPEWELCVNRLSNNGPLYVENIGKI